MKRFALLALGAMLFGVLVLLNAGGYRYGVTDQAFYIPIVLHQLTPVLYPRGRTGWGGSSAVDFTLLAPDTQI